MFRSVAIETGAAGNQRLKFRYLLGIIAIVSWFILVGCATPPRYENAAIPAAAEMKPGNETEPGEVQVILQPYDVIRVRFLYWPELDDEQTIRPDGKISLLMVGDVKAQGLTLEQLQQQLMALYKEKINDPDINVVVTTLASNRVYVGGEVATPGLILIESKLTALGAIMQAGGFLEDSAKKASVVVVRQREGKQYACTIDLRKTLEHPETDSFALEPYDVVYVPRTKIARVDQFVQQYLSDIVPRWISTGYNWNSLLDKKTKTSTSLSSITSGATGRVGGGFTINVNP